MAQAQRRRQQARTVDDTIRELRDITGRLTNPQDQVQKQAIDRLRHEGEGYLNRWQSMTAEEREKSGITPEQMERLRRALGEMNRRVQDLQGGRLPPQQGRAAAPQRLFNYDVTIGSGPDQRTFRVTMHDPLPHGRESQMLLEMAHNHEFFEPGPSGIARVTTPGVPAARAEVSQLSGPGAQQFNNGPNMARVDNFEVALNRAGEANPPIPIGVATVTPGATTQPRRGG